jgi:hypothetical protein
VLERVLAQQRVAVARGEEQQLATGQRDDMLDEVLYRLTANVPIVSPKNPATRISRASDFHRNIPHMTDFLDEKRKEIQTRLKELKPLVDEYQRLEAAERALAGVGGRAAPRPAASAPPARRSRSSSNGRRGRPKGSGTRAVQALELVRARPGITIPELAEAMGIKQNYLYRVMPTLAEEGQVVKSGRGWHSRDKSE